MRRVLLSLTAAAAIVSAASHVPSRADAMTAAGAASSIRTAAEAVDVVDSVRRRCWHRWNSTERCRWRRHWRW